MKITLSTGDLVLTKECIGLYKKEYSYVKPTLVEKDSVSLILAVRKHNFQLNEALTLCMLCSKSGQLGWMHIHCSKIDKYFSVLAPA